MLRPAKVYGQPAYLAGQERMIAVMFADIRSFTGIGLRNQTALRFSIFL